MKLYIVQWNDPSNSVSKKGAVEYRGTTVFSSLEEAKQAAGNDKMEELEYNPRSNMTWTIMELPTQLHRV